MTPLPLSYQTLGSKVEEELGICLQVLILCLNVLLPEQYCYLVCCCCLMCFRGWGMEFSDQDTEPHRPRVRSWSTHLHLLSNCIYNFISYIIIPRPEYCETIICLYYRLRLELLLYLSIIFRFAIFFIIRLVWWWILSHPIGWCCITAWNDY